VAKSEAAGWGVYTKHALKRGDYIHEYLGELISQEEAERRGVIYDKMNMSYLFNLSSDLCVDASRKGNKTRFMNHSSKPNVEVKMIWVNGDIRIAFFAGCDIDAQTEVRVLSTCIIF
jgi:histone-lysine N-methyltransferase EZH2